ncbi:MAG: ATP synthase subunit b [Thermodesulfobacteriota bacterium]|nr:MAG: ATP synthase subunit b [Thermodesulfobacteriota bacterium]
MTDFEILNLILTNASEGGNTFNWRYVFEHTVNLVLLLGVLVYFLKDSVRNFLVERKGSISSEIDHAQNTIAEAKNKYEEYAQKLKGIEDEINSIKESIVKQGQSEREEILRQASLASENIKKEAQETIEFEAARAKQEIQSEVVTLALEIAEKIIKENLSETDKQRFVDEFTTNVGDNTWHQSQH